MARCRPSASTPKRCARSFRADARNFGEGDTPWISASSASALWERTWRGRFLEAGHTVVVYDTRQEAIGNLAARGAIAARSPAELADAAETVMASLPTPDIVLAVVTSPGGVIEGRKVGRFVDLSTTGAVTAGRIFEKLPARNIVQIDSPVSGGVRGAEKGTLAVMVSGPHADIAVVEPALKVIGKLFVVGERPGLGQTMKLVNNALSATAMAATSEALVTGFKAGLDPQQMLDHQCRHRAQHGDRR